MYDIFRVFYSFTLYLTRLFHLFCELWPVYYMNPTDVIVLRDAVKVAQCISAC